MGPICRPPRVHRTPLDSGGAVNSLPAIRPWQGQGKLQRGGNSAHPLADGAFLEYE